MTSDVTVVGINRTQDGSIAVARGGSELYSLQKERVSRRKHHWGRLGDLPDLYLSRMPHLDEPVDLVVECYSSDTEFEKLDAYQDELRRVLRFSDGERVVRISHHFAHLYSAFYPSPFDEAAVMVIDAQGSRVKDFNERFEGDEDLDPELLEVSSFYRCRRGRLECITKQVWDGDWNRPAGLGCFYSLLTRMLFPDGEGSEGKVMGLAPFGKPGTMGMPSLVVEDHRVFIPDEWMKLFEERDRFRFSGGQASFEECANLAAEGQHAFETALLAVTGWLGEQTGMRNLCFAGGTALNCSANGRLVRETAFDKVFIPPSPHDGGTAVGCAVFGLVECLGVDSEFRWVNDFLGPEPNPSELEQVVRELPPDLVVEKPDDLVERIVELLDTGRVVGVRHGRSESGPRALGNRSILADARNPRMQDFINSQVKGREWFRPLAPLVLLEAAPAIFDIDRPAPFMQFATSVRPEHRDRLPAITHVDGSARIQTVEPENTPFLHAILDRFSSRTGCPVLLNTSLNGKGDPVVETAREALDCLTTTAMHAMAMPPYLIRKRAEPPVPARD
ncbi:MAG: carbamoyltransferase [Actinomycetota bacterium]|nr:carbamoyltransferase [Actinomycetota bacterium]